MTIRRLLPVATAALLLGGGELWAEGLQGRWSVAVQAGTDSEVSGHILGAATGTLAGEPVTINAAKYRSVYKPNFRGQVLIGYGISEKSEILVRGSHYKSNAAAIEAGKAGENPVYAVLDPYVEWGVEVAWHRYLVPNARLKTYFGPVAGARFLDAILGTFTVPAAGVSVSNVPLHKAGAVAVFGADLGFSFDLGRKFYVGLETGIRYQTAPGQANALPRLQSIDDGADRWSAPVTATLGVRF